MKTKDWHKVPTDKTPAGADSGETKWVIPEKFFDELPQIIKEMRHDLNPIYLRCWPMARVKFSFAWAPTIRSTTWPFFNKSTVGIPRT